MAAKGEVKLEQVYEALGNWSRQQARLEAQLAQLQVALKEATAERDSAIKTITADLDLGLDGGASLQHAVELALSTFRTRMTVEQQVPVGLRAEIEVLKQRIADLELDIKHAVDRLSDALEYPRKSNRSLGTVVADALNLIEESKLIIREHI